MAVASREMKGATDANRERSWREENTVSIPRLFGFGQGWCVPWRDSGDNYVVHFDHWWNPAREDQANGRILGIGQKKDAFIAHVWVENSVEGKIQAILARKRELFGRVIDSQTSAGGTELSADARQLASQIGRLQLIDGNAFDSPSHPTSSPAQRMTYTISNACAIAHSPVGTQSKVLASVLSVLGAPSAFVKATADKSGRALPGTAEILRHAQDDSRTAKMCRQKKVVALGGVSRYFRGSFARKEVLRESLTGIRFAGR